MSSLLSDTKVFCVFIFLSVLSLSTHSGITQSYSCPDLREASEDSVCVSRSKPLKNPRKKSLGVLGAFFNRFNSEKKSEDDQAPHKEKFNVVDFNEDGKPVFRLFTDKELTYHPDEPAIPSYKWRPDELYTLVSQNKDGKLIFYTGWRNQSGINRLLVEPKPLLGKYHSAE